MRHPGTTLRPIGRRLVLVVVMVMTSMVHGFGGGWWTSRQVRPFTSSSGVLFYQNEGDHRDESSFSASARQQKQQQQRQQQQEESRPTKINPNAVLTIPVLGPLPGQPPLLLGADFSLDPPTPWQWQTIEEAVWQHDLHVKNQYNEASDDVSIDAAPLVAILDESSRSSADGRYATIAAIVGMTTTVGGTTQGYHNQQLDMTDLASFQKSLRRVGRSYVLPWESKVRLVGIGRARLTDYYYRVPSRRQDQDAQASDEAFVQKTQLSSTAVEPIRPPNTEDEEVVKHMKYIKLMKAFQEQVPLTDKEEEEDEELRMNIMMAHFTMLSDTAQPAASSSTASSSSSDWLTNGHIDGTSRVSSASPPEYHPQSPVHALADMSIWANKMDFLHATRRKLVAGLQAGTARLQWAQQQQQQQQKEEDGFGWEEADYDGLGSLPSAAAVWQQTTATNHPTHHDDSSSSTTTTNQNPLAAKENYGMGYTASSFSTIPQVTSVLLEQLEPYYSPERRATEEYYYEILSLVAVQSLQDFLDPTDMVWAMESTHTVERMHQAYDWLYRHVQALHDEANKINNELQALGQDGSDLW